MKDLPDKSKGKIKVINVKEVQFPEFDTDETPVKSAEEDHIPLLMDVSMQVRVEIGKTKRTMKEILHLQQGSIIKLEKQAGAPVDIIINEQTIAKGDVIVTDDNLGVRVTEIIGNIRLDSKII